jgi:hypothetical protein
VIATRISLPPRSPPPQSPPAAVSTTASNAAAVANARSSAAEACKYTLRDSRAISRAAVVAKRQPILQLSGFVSPSSILDYNSSTAPLSSLTPISAPSAVSEMHPPPSPASPLPVLSPSSSTARQHQHPHLYLIINTNTSIPTHISQTIVVAQLTANRHISLL